MSSYTVKLKSKEQVAEGTIAFHWEKPEGFEFKAGQYADWTLINPSDVDEWSAKHSFTIASAPYESDLIFATRMRDTPFKRDIKALEPGAEIRMEGPNGEFVLHDDPSIPAVFITGGIGATPVRSILLQAYHDDLPYQIIVFYSNRRPEDAAFLELLSEPGRHNPNFRFIATMTEMDKSHLKWTGETGLITEEILKKYIADLNSPIYYVDGPPKMVESMKKMLSEAGISDDKVKTEDFEGY